MGPGVPFAPLAAFLFLIRITRVKATVDEYSLSVAKLLVGFDHNCLV